MQANLSLILNVILLIGVVIAIGRLMKARRQNMPTAAATSQPILQSQEARQYDDIIAIRKVNSVAQPTFTTKNESMAVEPQPVEIKNETLIAKPGAEITTCTTTKIASPAATQTVMIFLQAKENRQLAGYELLQTVLAAGFRFGENQLFHRHQLPNGQGPILCSLAAATATGTFDLQNIGAFTVRGLCLFMQSVADPLLDAERLDVMMETAKILSEGLDTRLLDDRQRPFNEETISHYYQLLNIPAIEHAD